LDVIDLDTLKMNRCHISCHLSVSDDSTFLESILIDSHLLSIIDRRFLKHFYRLTISVIADSQYIYIGIDETFAQYYQWTNIIDALP
jgi:hypothetical protein